MRLPRFGIRTMMIAVAAVGLLLAGALGLANAAVAKALGSSFATSYVGGWACLYGIPLMLMVTLGKRVSPRAFAKLAGKAIRRVLPFATLLGLFLWTMNGGLPDTILWIGMTTLFSVAFAQMEADC